MLPYLHSTFKLLWWIFTWWFSSCFNLHRCLHEDPRRFWSLLRVCRESWTPGEREVLLFTVHWWWSPVVPGGPLFLKAVAGIRWHLWQHNLNRFVSRTFTQAVLTLSTLSLHASFLSFTGPAVAIHSPPWGLLWYPLVFWMCTTDNGKWSVLCVCVCCLALKRSGCLVVVTSLQAYTHTHFFVLSVQWTVVCIWDPHAGNMRNCKSPTSRLHVLRRKLRIFS